MPSTKVDIDAICARLETEFNVNDYFYPTLSFELDVPGHLSGEVQKIHKYLRSVHIEPTLRNIYEMLSVKRRLIQRYSRNPRLLVQYREYVARQVRPVGAVGPLEYTLATIVMVLATFFLRGLLEESGRISARRLFERHSDRDLSRKIGCNITEVRLARRDAVVTFFDLRRRLTRKERRSSRSAGKVRRTRQHGTSW